ncbi:hypothetical protein GQ42DRAFT_41796 [Ramicandelaber brevisporus]|nr:hypothetical protein GQ42DRAFT_41796 [Ramicandelaber brevisporus]
MATVRIKFTQYLLKYPSISMQTIQFSSNISNSADKDRASAANVSVHANKCVMYNSTAATTVMIPCYHEYCMKCASSILNDRYDLRVCRDRYCEDSQFTRVWELII